MTSLSLCVLAALVVLVNEAAPASAAERSPDARRRAHRRSAAVDDVRRTFGGVEGEARRRRLAALAREDVVAAVLEYNEMVLADAEADQAGTCWMRLNYNVTASASAEQFTDLFRDQVDYKLSP